MFKKNQRISLLFSYIFLFSLYTAEISSVIQDTEETVITNCRLAKNLESKYEYRVKRIN